MRKFSLARQRPWTFDVIIITFLIVLALSLSITYQKESIVDIPLRADAGEYFNSAYNYYVYGIYNPYPSSKTNIPKEMNFRRQPGYPMLLYLLFPISKFLKIIRVDEFLSLIATVQAIIGALTVTLIYILCRLHLSRPLAGLAGFLTALNPHLIALEQLVLTETLLTFILVAATLVFVLSCRKGNLFLSLTAGALFGYAFLVHLIAILIGPVVSLLYLIGNGKKNGFFRSKAIKQAGAFLVGLLVVVTPYITYKQYHKTVQTSESVVTGRFNNIWGPLLLGSDINLEHFMEYKSNPAMTELKQKMKDDPAFALKVLKDKIMERPFTELRWFLYGKFLYLWRWDNFYVGDVYQYPMIRKGFEENIILRSCHRLMRTLHEPLFALTLLAPLIMLIQYRRNVDIRVMNPFTPLILVIAYYYLLFLILAPLPRYGIPLRPFSYALAAYSLHHLWVFARMAGKVKKISDPVKTK